MSNYTRHDFTFTDPDPNGTPGPWSLCTLVMDDLEFDDLVNYMEAQMSGTLMGGGGRANKNHFDSLREARHIPMIARGSRTEPVFNRYAVESKFLSVIVRGEGVNVLGRMLPGQTVGQA